MSSAPMGEVFLLVLSKLFRYELREYTDLALTAR
jgi:hypothetical protein